MRGAGVAAALLALAGCWVPVERGRQMESRIADLEVRNEALLRQLEEQRDVLRDRVAKADAKIAEVQKKLDELNTTAHRTGADVVARQDQLQGELAQLRGLVEEAQQRVRDLDQALAASRQETDGRFAALRGAGALDQYEARRKIEALKKPSEPKAFFDLARQQEAAGERAVAKELYEEQVRRWPADPASAEALYRLGEFAATDGRHREAVLAFGKVAQDHARSDRAPDAMLRSGDALLALGMKDDAVGVWRELLARHPKTGAAKLAGARIAEHAPPAKAASQAPKSAPKAPAKPPAKKKLR
jgi:TolA-binding protein